MNAHAGAIEAIAAISTVTFPFGITALTERMAFAGQIK